MTDPTTPAIAKAPASQADTRRALISSFLGSTVEYYDFLLYGAAAGLVFPDLFFPSDMDHSLGATLSFVILLAGYVSRPIGGILFGHFGDRFGRRNMLVITLTMMGLVSVVIGLMPTYETIGVAAPIVLVVLRVVQGLAVGGEWAGATLMAAEHVEEQRRGFAASVPVTGGAAGSVLATLILGAFSGLPDDAFLGWGWRIPFLLSAALVVVGLYIRRQVTESPEFADARAEGSVHTGVPILSVLRLYRLSCVYGILAAAGPLFLQALLAVWVVPHVADRGVVPRQDALYMLTFSTALFIVAIPTFARLSDRFGRRPVMLAGAALSAILVFPMFALLNSSEYWLVALGFVLGNPIMQAAIYGPMGAFLAEKFATEHRYTGVSLTYQVGSVLGAGTAPLLANWLFDLDNGGGTNNIACYFLVLLAIAALAVYLSRETAVRSPKPVDRVRETLRTEH
ncbi:MFS transporter [Nocardia bovistercoris]|uniref:MHS family MFS transporter n=1 Tax=Nocardia bovistercoris TaxID=2785916 RepID=A0A931II30_9NOCA|nr:MFS transporter [Nocardia bovistercoris]MBH0780018.1 MHS family MFS transporter [Nocardia bovistercoris]